MRGRLFGLHTIKATTIPTPLRTALAFASSAKPYASVFANQAVSSLFNFAITIFLVRLLGITEFGTYHVLAIIGLGIVALVNALVTQPLVSLGSQLGQQDRSALIESAIGIIGAIILVFLGLLGIFLPVAIALNIPVELVVSGFLLSVSMLLFEFIRRLLFFYQKFAEVWKIDIARILLIGAGFLSLSAVFAVESAIPYILWTSAANALIVIFCIFRSGFKAAAMLRPAIRSDGARQLLQNGKWLSIGVVTAIASDQIIVLSTAAVLGSNAVGAMRAPQAIIGAVNPIFIGVEYFMPRILGERVRRDGWARALRSYMKGSAVLLAAMTGALAVVAFLAEPLCELLLGYEAARYFWALQLTALGYVATFATILVAFPLRAANRTSPILISNVVAAILAILGSAILTPAMGILGAMLTFVLSQYGGLVTLCAYLIIRWPLDGPAPSGQT